MEFLLELVEGCMFHHLSAVYRQTAEFYFGFLAAVHLLMVGSRLVQGIVWVLELVRLDGFQPAMLDSCPLCFQALSGLRSQQIP